MYIIRFDWYDITDRISMFSVIYSRHTLRFSSSTFLSVSISPSLFRTFRTNNIPGILILNSQEFSYRRIRNHAWYSWQSTCSVYLMHAGWVLVFRTLSYYTQRGTTILFYRSPPFTRMTNHAWTERRFVLFSPRARKKNNAFERVTFHYLPSEFPKEMFLYYMERTKTCYVRQPLLARCCEHIILFDQYAKIENAGLLWEILFKGNAEEFWQETCFETREFI